MFFKGKSKSSVDYVIAGLGNPGLRYSSTRHNAGFMAVDKLAEKYNIDVSKSKHHALCGSGNIGEHKVMLIKPQTFMNLSGNSVREVLNFYKIGADRLIVICDDISLDVGKMRIRKKGSDGGQKGMLSIIEQLGTQDFVRIKIGVGKKPNPDYDLADWVLSTFKDDEKPLLQTAVDNASSAVPLIIDGKIEAAMNKFN